MDLIPLFKPINIDILKSQYNIKLDEKSEWVQIEFDYETAKQLDPNFQDVDYGDDEMPDYETNRYNITMFNPAIDETISVYIYLDESLEFIYAIDDIAQINNVEKHRKYTTDTLFDVLINDILMEQVV